MMRWESSLIRSERTNMYRIYVEEGTYDTKALRQQLLRLMIIRCADSCTFQRFLVSHMSSRSSPSLFVRILIECVERFNGLPLQLWVSLVILSINFSSLRSFIEYAKDRVHYVLPTCQKTPFSAAKTFGMRDATIISWVATPRACERLAVDTHITMQKKLHGENASSARRSVMHLLQGCCERVLERRH